MSGRHFAVKSTCHRCSAEYFDLVQASPACPVCGARPKRRPSPRLHAARQALMHRLNDYLAGEVTCP